MALPLGEPLLQTTALDVPALHEQGPKLIVLQGEAGVAEVTAADTIDTDELKANVRREIGAATAHLVEVVASGEVVEPANPEDRKTTLTYEPAIPEDFRSKDGTWTPHKVSKYNSYDPWQALNPRWTAAASHVIETTMKVAGKIRETGTNDATLTYFDLRRAGRGKRDTVITETLKQTSPGLSDWVAGLPAAERLRVVAQPWSDITTVEVSKVTGEIEETPLEPIQSAIMGGSGDGRAVREREAWERDIVGKIDPDTLTDNTLVITSLGTGTGEPAMDTSLALMAPREHSTVVVNGYDVNPNSLRVASHLAAEKQAGLDGGSKLVFNGLAANLLSKEGIQQSVGTTQANVYEAIGFSEYVPSGKSENPAEQKQRAVMARLGGLAAEDWYGAIYENMPEGSVFVTGNMRTDSPQLSFVEDGLGWQGIIPRSTEDYLQILKDAGIPSEAVELFVPGEESAGVYNLVAIRKLAKTAAESTVEVVA